MKTKTAFLLALAILVQSSVATAKEVKQREPTSLDLAVQIAKADMEEKTLSTRVDHRKFASKHHKHIERIEAGEE
jgi:hypothetical protein